MSPKHLAPGAAVLATAVFLATSVLAIEAPDRKPAASKPSPSAPAEGAPKEQQKEGGQAPAPSSTDQPAPPAAEQPAEAGATPQQPAATPAPQERPAADAPGAPGQKPGATAGTAQGENQVKDDPEDPKDSAAAAQAPKRFIPSTRSTADNNATFPVDI